MFPAGAIAWRISDEPFMQNVKAVSNLKLRASYGVTGNAGASEYATLDYSRTGIIGFQDVGSPLIAVIPNPSPTRVWDGKNLI